MKHIVKEPLLHFLLIGAGLFLLFGLRSGPAYLSGGQSGPQPAKIVVTGDDIDQLVETFARTWQRSPTEKEVRDLIESFVRDEIYYREAKAIGLDQDDSVIRRRLRLKMEYIFEDINSLGEPTEEELLSYMKKNPDSYLKEPKLAFRHVYINADKRGKNAEIYARQLLAKLENGADPSEIGDLIALEPEVRLLPLWDIKHQFGESFSESILKLEPGRWQGPIHSGYGLHLIFVAKFEPERLPKLNEVLDSVKRDWAVERQKKLKDAAYDRLRERYTVEIEKPGNLEIAKIGEVSGKVATR